MLRKSRKQPLHGSRLGYYLVRIPDLDDNDDDDDDDDTRVVIPFEVQDGYCAHATELTFPAQMPVALARTNPEKWDDFQRKLNKVTVTVPYFPNWWIRFFIELGNIPACYILTMLLFDWLCPNDFQTHMDHCSSLFEWGRHEYDEPYTKEYCDDVKWWKWGQLLTFLILVLSLHYFEEHKCRKVMDAWKTQSEPKLEAACRDFSPEAEAKDGYFVEYQDFKIQLRSVVSDGAGRGAGNEMV
jgi:hypothetical protein